MNDIDYISDTSAGFEVNFENNPRIASGNKVMTNRFEIVFLTNVKTYLLSDGTIVSDNFGGNAGKFVGQQHVLNNLQAIAASMMIAIEKTVESIILNQSGVTNKTERLKSASLVGLQIINDIVYAQIELIPEEYEISYPIYYNIPLKGA